MGIPKSWYTIALFLTFLAVAAALQWWQVPRFPAEIWIILLLSAVVFLSVGLIARSNIAFLFLCIIIGTVCAFLRVSQTTHIPSVESVDSFAIDRPHDAKEGNLPRVMLHGYISDEPDRRPMKTKYVVEVDEINGIVEMPYMESLRVHGKILVTDHAFYPLHAYGDEVIVTGILEKPTQIEDFAYDRYLSRYGIYAVIYRAEIETLSTGHGSRFFSFLYHLKSRFEYTLNRLLPEPHASLMAGLLTGSRRGIPDHLLKNFPPTAPPR